VVGKGRAQFEANLERSGRDGALLRFGVADVLELRLETEGRRRVENDLALGIKWHSQDRDPAADIPAVSWILHFDTPTGASLRTVATWDLPYELALGLMPGVKLDAAPDGHRFAAGSFAAALNRRWSESLRTFVEAAIPQIASGRDGGIVASWSIGAAYLLTNDWQLGVRAATAATRGAPTGQLLFELAGRY